jgi:hypothetical protein
MRRFNMQNNSNPVIKSTEKTIDLVALALKAGVHPNLCRLALLEEGFTLERTDVMLRWANRMVQLSQEEPDHGNL